MSLTVAVQQPYFFPYPCYFALLSRVDILVTLTDVQFPRRGWVHRNRLPSACSKQWSYLRIPVAKAALSSPIHSMRVAQHLPWQRHLRNAIETRYGHQGLAIAMEWGLEDTLARQDSHLLAYVLPTLRTTLLQLGLTNLQMIDSASLAIAPELRGSRRILAICKELGATTYWNLPGGKALYSKRDFEDRGIQLAFVDDPWSNLQGDPRESSADLAPWSILHAACSGREQAVRAVLTTDAPC